MALRFGDVRLLAEDYGRMFRFYQQVLELPVDWGDEQSGYAQFKCDALTLAIYDREAMARILSTSHLPAVANAQDRFVLSFKVDDVDAEARRLADRGAVPAMEPHDQADWGYRVAHFRDPDGNLIELFAPLEATR